MRNKKLLIGAAVAVTATTPLLLLTTRDYDFISCMLGPDVRYGPNDKCQVWDTDGDSDIDMRDYARRLHRFGFVCVEHENILVITNPMDGCIEGVSVKSGTNVTMVYNP